MKMIRATGLFLPVLGRQPGRRWFNATSAWILACLILVGLGGGQSLARTGAGRGVTAIEISRSIKMRALVPPPHAALAEFERSVPSPENIRALLASFDQYASYMTEEEASQLADLQTAMPMAIGVDIVHDREKRVICIPYAGSPAARAGIRYRDELLQVDGYLVSNLEIDDISSLIRGEDKGPVYLQVRGSDGTVREVPVERARVKARTMESDLIHLDNREKTTLPRIRIYRFTSGLSEKLGAALQRLQARHQLGNGLIIDLRGNTGGSFDSAETCAAMFLPRGAVISRTAGRDGKLQVRKNQANGRYRDLQLYIWQDDLTASAAEVFLSALEAGQRSLRIGSKTFGKARIQTVFPLHDGSLLKLTTARILYPDQEGDYQGIGFMPHILANSDSDESAYVRAMESEVVFEK